MYNGLGHHHIRLPQRRNEPQQSLIALASLLAWNAPTACLNMSDFPVISRGGSLLLAWQLRGRKVLIVGGGSVASDRIRSVLTADAIVTLVCPRAGLCAEVAYRLETEDAITYHDRNFQDSDLDDPALHMVLTAIDDPAASTHIYTLCHRRRININVADVPPEVRLLFRSQTSAELFQG